MSDQLTQAEIDALRDAVRSGKLEEVAAIEPRDPVAEVKVVSYDFRKPKLLSVERTLQLQLLHQTFVKSLQGMLFSLFKLSGESKLAALDQVTYGEYMLSLASPTYLIGLHAGPDIGPIGIELSPPMGQILLDMLLGGDGNGPAAEPPHEFSAFELEIMRTLSDRILEELQTCWKVVHDIDLSILSQGVSPEQVQLAPPDTPCLMAVIDSRMCDTSVRLHICYPFSTLQSTFERAEASREAQMGKRAELRKVALRATQRVPLPINVELGRATITARDLDRLEIGDVIKLGHATGDPLRLNIGERPIGQVHVGAHRGRMAACITTIAQPPKEADTSLVTPKPAAPAPAAANARPANPAQAAGTRTAPLPRPAPPRPTEKTKADTTKGTTP
jgi:flagellar motor switch protein FliM